MVYILQIVNPAKVLKIRVRGIKQDLTQDTSSEEVCIVMPGVVGRFDGSDIKVLQIRCCLLEHPTFVMCICFEPCLVSDFLFCWSDFQFVLCEDEIFPDLFFSLLYECLFKLCCLHNFYEMQSLLQQWFQESNSRLWDQDSNAFQDSSGYPIRSLPYQLWNVSKYGVCADAAITGVMPPPLMEIQVVI